MKFAFIDAEKAHHPITKLCRLLRVSRPGFYAWCGRPPSLRAVEDARLTVLIRESHERGRRYYGSPRIYKDLVAQEVFVSRKRVIRLMQADKIVARPRLRFRCTTMSEHGQAVAPNLLAQNFEATRPNEKWVGDTTELVTGEGRLYLAAVLDLFSRYVVGWAISASNNRHLTLKALEMALQRRCPKADLLHHSDQGSTYASEDYRDVLAARGITCSMSRRGNCYDNAAMESWFSTLKSELGERFDNHAARRSNCSTTSRCSTTSSGSTRPSATSARPRSSGRFSRGSKRRNQPVCRTGSSPIHTASPAARHQGRAREHSARVGAGRRLMDPHKSPARCEFHARSEGNPSSFGHGSSEEAIVAPGDNESPKHDE